jgi:hypothetical protein
MSSCDLWGRRKTGPRDVRVQLIELPYKDQHCGCECIHSNVKSDGAENWRHGLGNSGATRRATHNWNNYGVKIASKTWCCCCFQFEHAASFTGFTLMTARTRITSCLQNFWYTYPWQNADFNIVLFGKTSDIFHSPKVKNNFKVTYKNVEFCTFIWQTLYYYI